METNNKRLVKIVIPDAGPINTLAAANLLPLLLAPQNTQLVVIYSVFKEIILRAPELKAFMDANSERILIVKTSVCIDDEAKTQRGEPLGKDRGELAIAAFILSEIDEAIGNSPALIIYEDRKFGRLHSLNYQISENSHFITTAAYLRKLEVEGIIKSFDLVWKQITDANFSIDRQQNRSPNNMEVEKETNRGSVIFPQANNSGNSVDKENVSTQQVKKENVAWKYK